jgi:aminotransferase
MGPWLRASTANLQKKRDYTIERLNRMAGIRCSVPKGVYFAFPSIHGLGLSSFALAEHLLREGRVSVSPGIHFGRQGEGHVRVSFCPSIEQIREGLDRMEQAIARTPAISRVNTE